MDSSGEGNDGRLQNFDWNAESNWTTGYNDKGSGLKFDGGNDYVKLGYVFSGYVTNLTFEAWVYVVEDGGHIFFHYGNNNNDNGLFWGDGNIHCLLADGSEYRSRVSAPMSTNEWHHVVSTYDSQYHRLYVDGEEAVSNTFSYTLNWETGTPDGGDLMGVYYSGATPGASTWFDGTIDEFKVYDRALTEDEIQLHYLAGKARLDYADIRVTDSDAITLIDHWFERDNQIWVNVPEIPVGTKTIYIYYGNETAEDTSDFDEVFTKDYGTDNLVGYWRMDEGSGVLVEDLSGEGNDGYIAPWAKGTENNGAALKFDGSNDYVEVLNNPSFDINSTTLEAWIRHTTDPYTTVNANGTHIRRYVSLDGVAVIRHDSDYGTGWHFYVRVGGVNTWHHKDCDKHRVYTEYGVPRECEGALHPPKNYGSWTDVVYSLLCFLNIKERLGVEYINLWGEPEIVELHWRGSFTGYCEFYSATARAVSHFNRDHNMDVKVGGPRCRIFSLYGEPGFSPPGYTKEWWYYFIGFCRENDIKLDFYLSTPLPTDLYAV